MNPLAFAASSLLVAGALAGCGRLRYAYEPVTTTSAEVEGHGAEVVTMPAGGPKGELRIASLGVANVSPPSGVGTKPFHALFVRFVVDNQSAEPWDFDQAEQRLEIEGVQSWPVTATGARPPSIRIPAHAAMPFDVLFPVGNRDEGALARFEILWTVRTGSSLVAGRAAFARHTTTREPAPAPFEPEAPPPYRLPDALRGIPSDPCVP